MNYSVTLERVLPQLADDGDKELQTRYTRVDHANTVIGRILLSSREVFLFYYCLLELCGVKESKDPWHRQLRHC